MAEIECIHGARCGDMVCLTKLETGRKVIGFFRSYNERDATVTLSSENPRGKDRTYRLNDFSSVLMMRKEVL